MGMIATLPYAQEPQTAPQTPPNADFSLQVWAFFDAAALEEFKQRVQSYVELRGTAERGLPARRVTRDPAEIEESERRLAERIREARATASQGDVFVPPIESGIKRLLVLEVDRATLESISGDNPGEFVFEVNSSYPEGLPLSSVPPNILAMLPRLAEDLEYRFVGRHLILRDVRANVVIDHIPYAIDCTDCPALIEGEGDGAEEIQ
jgi:hypothetical protein